MILFHTLLILRKLSLNYDVWDIRLEFQALLEKMIYHSFYLSTVSLLTHQTTEDTKHLLNQQLLTSYQAPYARTLPHAHAGKHL